VFGTPILEQSPGWLTLVLFSRLHRKVKNKYHQNFQYRTEFVFHWAFEITLDALHTTHTTKVMGLAGSGSE
jgi:hypothetical protein